ncbi:RES domain-containing protein [Bradyrhizobium sp. SZCCHNS3051]|uniref:RES domain-containing protein n=1 Tax=Bradyrhizobium sp. SZCCHNS3051 TaxID=3057320 RepID=UPI00291688D2|nr:RES domain-containing protein [Bradyrhizobium sp. SZCCHNS3051]
MKLSACSSLPTSSEKGTWYRAVEARYVKAHFIHNRMKISITRFNAGRKLKKPDRYACLYLVDDPTCAQYEVGQQLGFPTPGNHLPNRTKSFAQLTIQVSLQRVADISDLSSQVLLGSNVQELTGDWKGYDHRTPHTSVAAPIGMSETQHLGIALYRTGIEGFMTTSAKIPWHKILVVFPGNLAKGSSIEYYEGTDLIHSFP